MARLHQLWLRDFRNYARAELSFAEGVTVFVGANGQGKSNLLEAVYLVATGRSHRTAHEAEAIRWGASAARVRAQVARRGRDEEIEITLSRDGARVSSQMRVNGAPTPRGGVLGRLPVVLAAAWDLDLVRGPGGGRRRLLDAALSQLSPAYFFGLHRYHRVVAHRNAELHRGVPGSLEPWDSQLVALGARITSRRAWYVEQMQPHAAAWFQWLGGVGALAVTYRPSWAGGTDEEIMEWARAETARLRADEMRRGVTLRGPHRDEVEFALDGIELRACGSQGQWRTAMLAVRLAERAVMAAELGASPVLMLDDALAELDPGRQRRALEIEGDAQVLATATAAPAVVAGVRVVEVSAGTVA